MSDLRPKQRILEAFDSDNPMDRIKLFYRYGEAKVELSEDDQEYLARLRHVRDMWLADGSEKETIRKTSEVYNLSIPTAENILADAKYLWSLSQKYDHNLELLLIRKWIDETYDTARLNGDGKTQVNAIKAKQEWAESMRLEQERTKGNEILTINIHYTMDFSEFMSKEQHEELMNEVKNVIYKKAMSRQKIEDAEYVEE